MGPHAVPWFGEIDLDPHGAWLRMGTRKLADRPWLVADGRRNLELALKEHLLATSYSEVFAAADDATEASQETLDLVMNEVSTSRPPPHQAHPLDRAGRMVQDDLCLLRPTGDEWTLAAASLCFPSRWRLADKFEKTLALVHGPVAGYEDVLSSRVDQMLNRLESAIVWRRNWFVHPDPHLYQPLPVEGGERKLPAVRCLDELFMRSERQTLRWLPSSGWVLFTIRVQQTSLRSFVATGERRDALRRFVAEADVALSKHKGISADQNIELAQALRAGSTGDDSRGFGGDWT